MPYRLLRHNTEPPGGFSYQQPPPLDHFFPSGYGLRELARNVSAFRQANNLARADFSSCVEDVEVYNATRVRNKVKQWKSWVVDSDAPYNSPIVVATRGGGCCGARIE